jgi:membrane protein implicated in regulation of membrane protease activity
MVYPTDAGSSGDVALTASLQSSLRPGEQLLWCGRPDSSVVLVAADLIAIPFSIVWLAIALTWEFAVSATGGPPWFRLVGVPFVLIGVYLLAGRFVTRWARKRKTIYAITNQRVIVQTGSVFRDTPVQGGSMSVRRRRNGRHATVVFEPFGSYYTTGAPMMTGPPDAATGMPTMGPPTRTRVAPGSLVFAAVADPDAMLVAINEAKGQRPAPPG